VLYRLQAGRSSQAYRTPLGFLIFLSLAVTVTWVEDVRRPIAPYHTPQYLTSKHLTAA